MAPCLVEIVIVEILVLECSITAKNSDFNKTNITGLIVCVSKGSDNHLNLFYFFYATFYFFVNLYQIQISTVYVLFSDTVFADGSITNSYNSPSVIPPTPEFRNPALLKRKRTKISTAAPLKMCNVIDQNEKGKLSYESFH